MSQQDRTTSERREGSWPGGSVSWVEAAGAEAGPVFHEAATKVRASGLPSLRTKDGCRNVLGILEPFKLYLLAPVAHGPTRRFFGSLMPLPSHAVGR